MNPATIKDVRTSFASLRGRLIHLLEGQAFPDMQTWTGCLRLTGLWFAFVVVCALLPFHVLLRLLFRRGGWRFLAVFLGVVAGATVVGARSSSPPP